MVYVNALVLGCYAFFGIALFLGYLLNSGNLVALAAIGGWFIVVYSLGVYLLVATLQFYRRNQNFWVTLYPVNCSLAFGAILLLGINGLEIALPLLTFAVMGASAGLIIGRSSLANMRALPLAALVPLLLCLSPRISPYWILVFSLVSAFLLMSYIDARLIRRGGSWRFLN